MARRRPRRLVVDASVARAAGETRATSVRASRCRDFLQAILLDSLRIVMTAAIDEEWRRHRSRFAYRWRRTMIASKRVDTVAPPSIAALRQAVASTSAPESDRLAMLKDLHLIEAALASDRLVASLDEAARRLFRGAAREIDRIGAVIWVNPELDDDDAIAWLRQGARAERQRMLGYDA